MKKDNLNILLSVIKNQYYKKKNNCDSLLLIILKV